MKIFYFPIRHQNNIIEINKNILASLGAQLLSLKEIYKFKNIIDTKKIVILNWVEDQPYLEKYNFLTSWFYFFYYFITIILSKLTSAKVIWIKHNFKPHIKENLPLRHYLTCSLLRMLRIEETTLEAYYGKNHIIHPLYSDDVCLRERMKEVDDYCSQQVVFFGHVKKYKGLHNVLKCWPKDLRLEIHGKFESKSYKQELTDVVINNNLNVTIIDKFLNDDELEELLLSTSHVLIPHETNSMISSGSFYHAISFGCNIIAANSDFAIHKARQHSFVSIYDFESDQFGNLTKVNKSKKYIIGEALDFYSRKKLKVGWRVLLNN